ncbi:MAG: DUF2079 domain-containing protein [Leptolyngbya sp. SIO1E4]|nr:DUF2079 domain-containing protein [Leptolyngbya sp. SIO1E4]
MILSWRKEPGVKRVALIAATFFVIVAGLLLHRYFTYYASYDQGIFNQVFWNNAHGRFFQSSASSQLSTNVVHSGELPMVNYHRLGQHFTPALLLWLPIYALFPSPVTLCVLQAAFTTLAGVLLYALARQYLEPRLSLGIMVSFYGALAVLNPILANFHDLSQMPLFMFGLLLAMERRRWWIFALLCLAILAVREDSAIALFGVGAYMLASRRYPRIGLGVCVLSGIYFLLVTNVFMPFFSDDISKRFMIEEFGEFIEGDEATTLEVLWALLSQPGKLLQSLVSPPEDRLEYLVGHWLPLAFVPAVSPAAWLMSAFPLMKLTLADSGLNTSIRYALSVVPAMFYGGILWWAGQGFARFNQPLASLEPRSPSRNFRRFWSACLLISLVFVPIANSNRVFYFILPDSFQPWVYVPPLTQWQRAGDMNQLVAQIPSEASVSATNHIVPHVSGRRAVLRLPVFSFIDDAGVTQDADYIVADFWRLQRYQVAFRRDRRELDSFSVIVNELLNTQRYGILEFRNGVVLLQKGTASEPLAWQSWQQWYEEFTGVS